VKANRQGTKSQRSISFLRGGPAGFGRGQPAEAADNKPRPSYVETGKGGDQLAQQELMFITKQLIQRGALMQSLHLTGRKIQRRLILF
jgi:hypothetical protein